jgi:tetratricopeptide (TPR) repeat protein
MAPLRTEFVTALREGRITSLGSTLGVEGFYATQGANVSLANMFFGFRKMAANLVWLEVDKYWHKGEMHRMIPLMKTCVTLDPTFIDAFLLGAWHLAYNATAPFSDTPWELRHYEPRYEAWIGQKETYYFSAIEYLKDGIRKNPRNYKLYFDLGYAIYEEKLANHPEAIKYLDEAIRLDHDRWVRRQLYRILGLNGQFEESKRGWENYHEWQPGNVVAPRFINLMEGEIKDRDANWLTVQASAAERLSAFAVQRGDAASAGDWAAKAKAKQEEAAKKYREAKDFWQELVHAAQEMDSYAYARVLRAKAAELRGQDRYEEAISYLEEARWKSNEFWDTGTDLILQYKEEANLPLQVTEARYLERKAKTLDYTRHLPKSIGGRMFRFADGQWRVAGYPGEGAAQLRQDSEEYFKILWEHPEVEAIARQLDGNIILAAGEQWFEYLSNTPAQPSRLYDPEHRIKTAVTG